MPISATWREVFQPRLQLLQLIKISISLKDFLRGSLLYFQGVTFQILTIVLVDFLGVTLFNAPISIGFKEWYKYSLCIQVPYFIYFYQF